MIPTRPLRVPTPADVRYAYGRCSRAIAPATVIDFMATIGPVVGDPFIVRTIAVAVVDISGMKPPERKIKYLDNLLSDINFPPEVAREINRIVDRIKPPPDFANLADRLVPPMSNLTGAILEPPFPVLEEARRQVVTSPVSRQAYDESVTAFQNLRDDLVRHISYGLVIHSVAPDPTRGELIDNAIERIPERLALLDLAAGIFGMTLHHPETWPKQQDTPLQLVATLNAAKARDTAVQKYVDDGNTITPARNLRAIVDDLVIDHCQRAISSGSRDLRTFAFWQQVMHNSPDVTV